MPNASRTCDECRHRWVIQPLSLACHSTNVCANLIEVHNTIEVGGSTK